MITTILWDFDNTLLDFDYSERNAIIALFKKLNLGPCTKKMLGRYSEINKFYWQKIERKEIDKKEALTKRFEDFFTEFGVDPGVAEKFNDEYEIALSDYIAYIDDSYNIVKSLNNKFKQYLVSNGTKKAQTLKLKKSKFDKLFDGVFISDIIGLEKPNVEYFNYIFNHIEEKNKSNIIIVGDTLTSDIQGGNNAKILTCWFNNKNHPMPKKYKIDFVIKDLHEIYDILKYKD